MGDTIEGSSNAAHSARPRQTNEQEQGWIRTLLTTLFGKPPKQDVVENRPSRPSSQDKLHGMINLRRLRVEDVAIPKAEIVAVAEDIDMDELLSVFRESGLTRLPVYSDTLDQPIGMVHLKDFSLRYAFNANPDEFDIKSLLRPLLFVPPSMPIGVLLTKMQTDRQHMALVIDEYGGVDGLLTIEDLIEQVVGEIEDEHDSGEDLYWTMEKPGQYVALARTPLEDFRTEINIDLTEGEDIDAEDIDTLGGLVVMLSGRVPVRGEVVEHPCGAEFQVLEADPRRVKRLRVVLPKAGG